MAAEWERSGFAAVRPAGPAGPPAASETKMGDLAVAHGVNIRPPHAADPCGAQDHMGTLLPYSGKNRQSTALKKGVRPPGAPGGRTDGSADAGELPDGQLSAEKTGDTERTERTVCPEPSAGGRALA